MQIVVKDYTKVSSGGFEMGPVRRTFSFMEDTDIGVYVVAFK